MRLVYHLAEDGKPTQVRGEGYVAEVEPMPGAKDGSWRVMLYKMGAFDEPLQFVSSRRVAHEIEGVARARRVIRNLVRRERRQG